uniref:Phosphatidate cytidylyltransferase n=1 Tax=Magnetococcus massalia (strain MO-1) TaxID=451514 RepID=A0A1S7LFI7_MAGMO|nr:Phosphatidate cytidylyltransferase [Candidatus Magnetococcus massalia]
MGTRILSALILAPLVLGIILYGGNLGMLLLLLVVAPLMALEWQGFVAGEKWRDGAVLSFGIWGLLTLAYDDKLAWSGGWLFLWSALLLAALTIAYRGADQPHTPFLALGKAVMGLIYIGIPLQLLLVIHGLQQGSGWVMMILFIMWGTDSGAYFAGRFFGTAKLAPHVSPKKTWQGFWGGLAIGTAAGVGIALALGLQLALSLLIVTSLFLSLAGQLGDLVESLMKRQAGIKDSGNIIPGHGGLLDRLDSLIYTAPPFYLILMAAGVA